ncbi:MAG: hypothetical protein PUG45_02620 [bacterium]|uniref:hypothetical protein n=1 Tax=Eubacterium ramulus TaxID=39490 RepID=UPI0022E75FEB|nr:hypothetical protein [Eubacterium ramulus]MDD6514333.1 hypothetical protein [bacterium]
MGEIDFSKKIIKILDKNILQMIIKKAVSKGFTVQGFTKNVCMAPETLICAALERKKKGKYQSSLFLDALNETEIDDEIVNLAKKWLKDKDERDEIERKIEQISIEKTEKKKKEVIIEEKSLQTDIKKEENENYKKEIQQLQAKNKKLQSTIQDLRIGVDNSQKEILRLQKEKGKLEKQIEENECKNSELKDEIGHLKEDIKKLERELDLYKQKNLDYQEIFKKAPKVICFSKKDINKDNFPFYNVDQLKQWSDECEETIKKNAYKEIWIIETDFSYSEVVKMKQLPCEKIVLKSNIKTLIEKVGGFSNGYAR